MFLLKRNIADNTKDPCLQNGIDNTDVSRASKQLKKSPDTDWNKCRNGDRKIPTKPQNKTKQKGSNQKPFIFDLETKHFFLLNVQ